MQGWGHRPVPLVPASLRRRLARRPLPPRLIAELRLPAGATARLLGAEYWATSGAGHLSAPARLAVLSLAGTHASPDDPIAPGGLHPALAARLQWSARARRVLQAAGVLDHPARLASMTWHDILSAPNAGPRTAIEIACLCEWAATVSAAAGGTGSRPRPGRSESGATLPSDDPRLTDVLIAAPRALHDQLRALLQPGGAEAPSGAAAVESLVPGLRARLEQLRAMPLEAALEHLLQHVSGTSGPRLRALVRRFGTDGEPAATLAVAGAMLGVTRERMRQIEEPVRRALAHAAFLPQLDAALEVGRRAAPCAAAEAAKGIADAGISTRPFHPRPLIALATLFRRTPALELTRDGRVRRSGSRGREVVMRAVARGQANASGAASIARVCEELRVRRGCRDADEAAVSAWLHSLSEFEFLDDGWFWHAASEPYRNRVRNVTRRALAVRGAAAVDVLRAGLVRALRWRRTRGPNYGTAWPPEVPPGRILARLYARHPEFTIDAAGIVRPRGRLRAGDVLGGTEHLVVEALRACPGGTAHVRVLREVLTGELGVGEAVLQRTLFTSPCVEPAGGGCWRLIPGATRRSTARA